MSARPDTAAPGEAARLVLAALAAAGGPLTTAALAEATGLLPVRVSRAAGQLVARGWAARPVYGSTEATAEGRAALAAGAPMRSGPPGPTGALRRNADTYRARLWRSIRQRRAFGLRDIILDAVRAERDAQDEARRYVRQLEAAGYLAPMPGRVPGWRLVRDPGPLAPVWSQARRAIRDPNAEAGHARS